MQRSHARSFIFGGVRGVYGHHPSKTRCSSENNAKILKLPPYIWTLTKCGMSMILILVEIYLMQTWKWIWRFKVNGPLMRAPWTIRWFNNTLRHDEWGQAVWDYKYHYKCLLLFLLCCPCGKYNYKWFAIEKLHPMFVWDRNTKPVKKFAITVLDKKFERYIRAVLRITNTWLRLEGTVFGLDQVV